MSVALPILRNPNECEIIHCGLNLHVFGDIEYLLVSLMIICKLFLEKCLFSFFTVFKIRL